MVKKNLSLIKPKKTVGHIVNALPSDMFKRVTAAIGTSSPIITKSLNIVLGVLLLVIAHFIARMAQQAIASAMMNQRSQQEYSKPQPTIADRVVGVCVYWAFMLTAGVIVLRSLGIETASIIAVLGSVGFALGLAMQGALGDLTAGVLLSVGVGFSVGDLIEVNDIGGIVDGFNLLYTTIKRTDTGHFVKIPNRILYGNIMHNHTRHATRSIVLSPMIANMNSNVKGLLQKIEERLMTNPKVLKNPPVHAQVHSITELGTILYIRVSINASNYPTVGNYNISDELMTEVKQIFTETGTILPDRVSKSPLA